MVGDENVEIVRFDSEQFHGRAAVIHSLNDMSVAAKKGCNKEPDCLVVVRYKYVERLVFHPE